MGQDAGPEGDGCDGDATVVVQTPARSFSDAEVMACHDVMRQLRPQQRREAFLSRVRLQERGGYRLARLDVAGRTVAVAGFRVMENLFAGRVMYVDDLVTDAAERSRGYGRRLLHELRRTAVDEGCDRLDLDSGNQRQDAHRFYLREGMAQTSLRFSWPLARGPRIAGAAVEIRDARPDDRPAVRALLEEAFGGRDEADLVERLRAAGGVALELVAEWRGAVVGQVMLSPMQAGRPAPDEAVLGLAPLAVAASQRRCGVGASLVETAISRMRGHGGAAIFLLGEPSYYARFGFAPASRRGLGCEYAGAGDAFQVLELVPGTLARLSGVIRYHAAFGAPAGPGPER